MVALARERRDDRLLAEDCLLARELLAWKPVATLEAWRRFSPGVTVTLRRMLGPSGDVEDLVQDVFLRFFEAIPSLRKLDSLRAFITGIAIRRGHEELRRRDVRRRLAHLLPGCLVRRSVELDTQSRDAVVRLYRALDALTSDERTLYLLRHVEGLDHAQLAAAFAVSVPTVRRRLDRLAARMELLLRADPVLCDYAFPSATASTERLASGAGGGPRGSS